MTDEDKLIDLLQQHRDRSDKLRELSEATAPQDLARRAVLREELKPISEATFELVDEYFRRELLPILTSVFGTGVVTRGDQSLRYTEWMQNFFVKMLDKRPDAFWKAQTAKDLRVWSSVVIANMMRTYLRRRKLGQTILHELAPLITEKQTYFENRYETSFEDLLDLLKTRESSDDENELLQATVLRRRYVEGQTWQVIAEDLGLKDEQLTKIRQQANRILQKKLSS